MESSKQDSLQNQRDNVIYEITITKFQFTRLREILHKRNKTFQKYFSYEISYFNKRFDLNDKLFTKPPKH